MRRTTSRWVVALIMGGLLLAGCTTVMLPDGGDMDGEDGGGSMSVDGGDQDADMMMTGDSGAMPDADAEECMTGNFGVSTFGNACFGD